MSRLNNGLSTWNKIFFTRNTRSAFICLICPKSFLLTCIITLVPILLRPIVTSGTSQDRLRNGFGTSHKFIRITKRYDIFEFFQRIQHALCRGTVFHNSTSCRGRAVRRSTRRRSIQGITRNKRKDITLLEILQTADRRH